MTVDESIRVQSLLTDVCDQMSMMLKYLDSSLVEHLNEEGVWLESWRDDVKSALEILERATP